MAQYLLSHKKVQHKLHQTDYTCLKFYFKCILGVWWQFNALMAQTVHSIPFIGVEGK